MSRTSKKFLVIGALCSAGTLFQIGLAPASCGQFLGQWVATSMNFCNVFNCTGGTFFNLCEPVPMFVDCPNAQTQTP